METFVQYLSGQLSSTARIWTALAPALVLMTYYVVALAVYAVRVAVRGPYRDPEVEGRGSSVLAGMWLRLYFAWVMQPLWRVLVRSGIPATAVTTLSALLGIASCVAAGSGRFALAGWLYIASGMCDFLDGRLARATNSTTLAGAALDSILDRYSDSAVLVGLGWYYRDSWVLLVVLFALVGSSLVPYIRARGEGVGVSIKVGVMQRAERIVYLGISVALSPIVEVFLAPNDPHPPHRMAIAALVLLAVSTQLTALQRLIYLLAALGQRIRPDDFWSGGGPLGRRMTASSLATALDFVVVLALVTSGVMLPPWATAVGCVVGGMLHFPLMRVWTGGPGGTRLPQMGRYTLVSVTSALLNSGGVLVMLFIPSLDYRLAWVLVRGAVFLAWSFPLQRSYVFTARAAAQAR